MTNKETTKPRILKVEHVGDFNLKRTFPRIRLQGKWLQQAGMIPNHHVQVSCPKQGVLIMHLIEEED